MKIGYLLGACGLAMTGAASVHAADTPAPGTPEFRRMVDDARDSVRQGRTNIPTLTHLNPVEDRIPYSGGRKTTSTRGAHVPHTWASRIDA